MKVLIIEDEKRVSGFISRGLKEKRYLVEVVDTGEEGFLRAVDSAYDVIILDLMLPDIDGLSLCKKIRNEKVTTPILILSAKSGVKDRVTGLQAGADDYLTKPFAFEELLARLMVLSKRGKKEKSTQLQVADLKLNQITHQVERGGKPIQLTTREYNLLEYLMLHSGQVVTRTMICERVWDESFDTFSNVIDVYINYLRSKIDKGYDKPLIHTIRGTGYCLSEDKL